MATNIKRIIYFHYRMDATADRIRAQRSDIDMQRRDYGGSLADNWAEMERAHGYHATSRVEMREPWYPDAKLFAKTPNLLAICSLGAGYDVIDVDACTQAGIIVCNQSGANKEAVAEHALAFMLALSKKIPQSDREMRRRSEFDRFLFSGNNLTEKTVGIVGIGQIGSRVAELCKGLFNMTVLAYDPYLTAEQIAARGATKVGLEELMRRSDFVTLHCPRTNETFGLIGYDQVAMMKPTAYFINTSRGGTYKEDDLVRALKEKKIAGAGLDVFMQEPTPTDHPLMQFDNVLLTPHIAGGTQESMANVAIYSADQWIDIFDGKVPPRLINRAAWPKYSERFQRILGFKPQPLE